jgi:hypothetical protein
LESAEVDEQARHFECRIVDQWIAAGAGTLIIG